MAFDTSVGHDTVVTVARRSFRFLEDRDFSVEVEDRVGRTVIAYIGSVATFEVELDWREQAAFVLVCRTMDGHRPTGYYVSGGKRVRVHLIEALRKTGLLTPETERRLREATRLSGEDAMLAQLGVLAEELRDNLDQLLAKFAVIFPN